MTRFLTLFISILFFLPVFAHAENPQIVIIYDNSGKKSDSAFIDMARKGAELAKAELGTDYSEHPLKEGEDREQIFRRYARQGARLIIGLGFQNTATISTIAPDFPDTQFTVVDGLIPPLFQNVQSIVFRDNEGAFLVGMMAALHSKTGTIGFIGGMDVPLIRDFAYGYKQGARYAKSSIKLQQHMIGKSKDAFNDPKTAAKLAKEQIDNGADVLFAAAGGSAIGMLQTAAQYDHVYAIGIDTNQNDLFPGTMLSSLVKRVDKAVYNTIKQSNLNTWESGIQYLGIKEGALDYAVDIHNRKILPLDIIDQIEKAKDFILRGIVQVDSYQK